MKIDSKTSIKRLKNQKKGIIINNRESKRNASKQEASSEKRVKQESLSANFVKKLREGNTITQNTQQTIQSQTKVVTAKIAEQKKIDPDVRDKKDSKSDKPARTVNFDISNESVVSFTKPTKKLVGKTLLAKKKDTSKNEQKSLSDIFSNQSDQSKNQTESNISGITKKYEADKNSKSNKEVNVCPEEDPLPSNETNKIDLNKRKKQKYKEKTTNNKKSDETSKSVYRVNGKASSLFGNNPDIPIIGQRFVKPVDEPIFTEITFADLNIHPYMVSIWIINIILLFI